MTQTNIVEQHYANDKNLAIRKKLHAEYSTNKQGFFPWLFEQYRFHEDDSILELGCGNGGQWDGKIDALPGGCKLVLSDFSEGMVHTAMEKFSVPGWDIAFQVIDIQEIPFPDQSFDIVIANHMLYHVPDLDKALSEVSRVLKKDGRFYAATNGNGGMSLFLHNAFKQFNPETEAFSQRVSFSLQNGKEILGRFFESVERLDYEDSLMITSTQDLMDWINTTISFSACSDEDFGRLYGYFEDIRKRDGAINIPKEVGLFVCM